MGGKVSLLHNTAFADGVLAIIAAITGGAAGPRWWLATVGIAGIAAGVLTFLWLGITALVLLLFIAAWAIGTGGMQIIGAIRLRKEIDNEWFLVAGGVLSVIVGLRPLVQPGTGALALIFVIGIRYPVRHHPGVVLATFAQAQSRPQRVEQGLTLRKRLRRF
jgi:uncharacterized membrane protein HdeD (DUF308 family)